MTQTLFGELKEDLFFEIAYRGPSFSGSMEIGDLGVEMAGLKDCLYSIIKVLSRAGKIDFNLNDIEILVEAFEVGSFKKKIKFLKKVNKHCKDYQAVYVAVSPVLTLLAILIPIIIQHGPKEINRMSPELMADIADDIKIELLSDKTFKQSLINIVTPIRKEDDYAVFNDSAGIQKIKLSSEENTQILGLKDEEETIITNNYTGRISEMDLDALRNQIGFKINGRGLAIPCSFNQGSLEKPIDVKEYIPFLGKWVQVDGTALKKGRVINHIEIKSISEVKLPKQENLPIK